jgi:hypothetical protein
VRKLATKRDSRVLSPRGYFGSRFLARSPLDGLSWKRHRIGHQQGAAGAPQCQAEHGGSPLIGTNCPRVASGLGRTGGVVADRSERRNLTRAPQAMRLALLYPEPDKRDLGKTIKRERKELARGHAGAIA